MVWRHGGRHASGRQPDLHGLQTYINTITNASGFQSLPSNITSLAGNTYVWGPNNGGPYFVVFRNQLAQIDAPRFFGLGTIGTNVSVSNISGQGDGAVSEGAALTLTYTVPGTAAGQQTRPIPYQGRNTPPTAQAVQDALNDLPALSALNRPISVTSNTNEIQTLSLSTALASTNTFVLSYGAASEVQTLTFGANPTSGTFTLTNGTTQARL